MNKLSSRTLKILLIILLFIIEISIFWLIRDTIPFIIHGKTVEAQVTMLEDISNKESNNRYFSKKQVHYEYKVKDKIYKNIEEISTSPRNTWNIPKKDETIKVVYHSKCPDNVIIAYVITSFYGIFYITCIYMIFTIVIILSKLKTNTNFLTIELYCTNLILTFYLSTIFLFPFYFYWSYQAYNFSSSSSFTFCIAFSILFIISLNSLLNLFRKLRRLKILKERGKPYKASILSNEIKKFFYIIKYQYQLEKDIIIIGETRKISRCKELKKGDIVEIIYDPINPSTSILLDTSAPK